jgi:Trypsin-like peptidase domain/Effector-associated domain 1
VAFIEPMQLSGQQFQQFQNLMLSAFSLADLDQFLRFRLDKNREAIAIGGSLEQIVFEVIRSAEMEGWTAELIAAARDSRPGRADLAAFAASLELATPAPGGRQLERMIEDDQGFLDPAEWRSKLGQIETRVCQIEYLIDGSRVTGTGFLVAPDLVLTAQHVVEPIVGGKAEPGSVRLRFDFKKLADQTIVSPGVEFSLDDDWLVDQSPPSPVDEMVDPGGQVSEPDQLDYALLRVAGEPGLGPVGLKSEPGAPPRGWISGSKDARPGTTLFVVQHPDGMPIRLAPGMVGEVNANATRVRYNANTLGGSSGAPCFDVNWELVALHHSGDPNFEPFHHPTYNEGIPLAAIRAKLENAPGAASALVAPG